jgi:hypothetical protein
MENVILKVKKPNSKVYENTLEVYKYNLTNPFGLTFF